MTTTAIGEALRSRMVALGLNQSAAADQCGASRSVFSYWLSGKGTLPSLEAVPAVADFLDVDIDAVLAMYPATYKIRAAAIIGNAELAERVARLETQVVNLVARLDGK